MYAFESRIRYSETDTQEKLKLESLIDYFQDCSSFQSEDRGVGFSFMREHHVAWIVNYWQIDVVRRPGFGEKVRIGTYPYGFKGFIGLRNFRMETASGEKLADANSVWSLFDLQRGVPVKALPEMLEAYTLDPKFDMEYLPRKIKIPKADNFKIFPEIPVSETMLDSNGHVNNGQYVRLAMSLVGDESEVKRLRVEYVSQAHLGDVIVPKVYAGSGEKSDRTSDTDGKAGVRTIVLASGETGKAFAVIEVS